MLMRMRMRTYSLICVNSRLQRLSCCVSCAVGLVACPFKMAGNMSPDEVAPLSSAVATAVTRAISGVTRQPEGTAVATADDTHQGTCC